MILLWYLLWYPPALIIRQRWTWTLLRFVITIWQGLKIVTTSTIASHLISTMLSHFSSCVCLRHALKLFASKAIIGAIASLSATPYLHLHHLIYTDTNTNNGKYNYWCKHWWKCKYASYLHDRLWLKVLNTS